MNDNYKHVESLSRKMKKICTFILVIIPVGQILIWTNIEEARQWGFLQRMPYQAENITNTNLVFGFFVSGILTVLAFMAIYHLRQFFIHNSEGKSFTIGSSMSLHSFAKYLIAYSLISIPVGSALSVIMSINNPVGQRQLSLTIQTQDLMLVFLGFVIFTISWVMKESVQIAAENAEII